MRIMVFDVPAESGGALSVLHEFYEEYKTDNSNEYIFIVSKPEIQEASNIKVIRFPWIKKSWIHRLYFDHFIAPKLITKYKVDRVLSLQNIMIPHTKSYQTVFVHNALPFSEYRFSFSENRFLWIYQNIIGKNIMRSIRKADHVIVQTNWMKKKCLEELHVTSKKIEVKPPKVNIEVKKTFQETKESLSTFFYPASGVIFKNHKLIVDACIKLKEKGISNYNVIFTLEGNENKNVSVLFDVIKNNKLPVKFIGAISREEVYEIYPKSVLVFPSFIETIGLPLIEAYHHGSPIFVANCEYAREVLQNNNVVSYFNPWNANDLVELMERYISM